MLRITSPNYYPARREPIEVIVLHTAQTPCKAGRAAGVMTYLANDYVDASAHYCTDPDMTVAGVDDLHTAWATPGVNANGLQVEQAGYAEFGSGVAIPGRMGDRDGYQAARDAYGEGAIWPAWTDPEPARMLDQQTIPLLVELCRRHNLPPVLLEPDDLRARRRGITDHARAAAAFDPGGHWDCGHHYPIHDIVARVAAQLTGEPTPDMPATVRLIRHPGPGPLEGSIYWWDGQTRVPVSPEPGTFASWDDLRAGLERLIAVNPSASRWDDTPDGLYLDIPAHDLELIPIR